MLRLYVGVKKKRVTWVIASEPFTVIQLSAVSGHWLQDHLYAEGNRNFRILATIQQFLTTGFSFEIKGSCVSIAVFTPRLLVS